MEDYSLREPDKVLRSPGEKRRSVNPNTYTVLLVEKHI